MANVTVAASRTGSTEHWGMSDTLWLTDEIGYHVSIVSSSLIEVYKTTNGSNSTPTWTEMDNGGLSMPASTTLQDMMCFAGWETPGVTDNVIHIVLTNRNPGTKAAVVYIGFDTATDAFVNEQDVDTSIYLNGGDNCAIAVNGDGNVLIQMSGSDDFGNNPDKVYMSTDVGANWTAEAEPGTIRNEDEVLLTYAEDASAWWEVMLDTSAATLYANYAAEASGSITWDGFTSIASSLPTSVSAADGRNIRWHARFDPVANKLCVAYWNEIDSSTGDLKFVTITRPASTITVGTAVDIITNSDDIVGAVISVNPINGDLYVDTLGVPGGTDTWTSSVQAYRYKSADGGATWDSGTAYSSAADDYEYLAGSVGDGDGATGMRIMAPLFEDTDTTVYVDAAGDIGIAAPAGGSSVPVMFHHYAEHWRKR